MPYDECAVRTGGGYTYRFVGEQRGVVRAGGIFVVDGKWNFNVFDHYDGNVGYHLTACGGIVIGEGNKIPLWLLGFLY